MGEPSAAAAKLIWSYLNRYVDLIVVCSEILPVGRREAGGDVLVMLA